MLTTMQEGFIQERRDKRKVPDLSNYPVETTKGMIKS